MRSKLIKIPSMIIGFVAGVLFVTSCGDNGSQVYAVTPVDQLICVVFGSWPVDGSVYPCIQSSDPSNLRNLSMTQVLQEGWTAISVGGGGDASNRITMIFHK